MHKEMAKHWEIVVRGMLGPRHLPGTVQNITVLNRLLTFADTGVEYEPDPRHAEILVGLVGSGGARVTTPMVKESIKDIDDEAGEEDLDAETAAVYKGSTMRAAYLSQDRPDLPCAVRLSLIHI